MKDKSLVVYVYYEDLDNSRLDVECCGGPNPFYAIKVFSSLEKAISAGHKKEDLKKINVDSNEWDRL